MNIRVDVKDACLFEGEILVDVDGIPGMYKYFEGKIDMPLIVFVPGGRSNARIYYGVHQNYNKENFLAYWLQEIGYPVLCISYPLEMRKPIFDNAYPGFSVRDWGRLISEITLTVVEQENLSQNFILIAWSAGGKSVIPTNYYIKDTNLNLLGFIGLAATPPVLGLTPFYWDSRMRETGHWHTDDSFPRETSQIMYNYTKIQDHIDEEILLDYYLGHNPVSILGTGWRYKENQFVKSISEDIEDNLSYCYHLYPLTASIAPSLITDIRHTLTDKSVWSFIRSQSIYERFYMHYGGAFDNISEELFRQLKSYVNKTSESLHAEISDGNHCFFIGKKGAESTANYICKFVDEIIELENEFLSILI